MLLDQFASMTENGLVVVDGPGRRRSKDHRRKFLAMLVQVTDRPCESGDVIRGSQPSPVVARDQIAGIRALVPHDGGTADQRFNQCTWRLGNLMTKHQNVHVFEKFENSLPIGHESRHPNAIRNTEPFGGGPHLRQDRAIAQPSCPDVMAGSHEGLDRLDPVDSTLSGICTAHVPDSKWTPRSDLTSLVLQALRRDRVPRLDVNIVHDLRIRAERRIGPIAIHAMKQPKLALSYEIVMIILD